MTSRLPLIQDIDEGVLKEAKLASQEGNRKGILANGAKNNNLRQFPSTLREGI